MADIFLGGRSIGALQNNLETDIRKPNFEGLHMRTIGKADVEFYEAYLVLKAARAIPGVPYDDLSYAPRQRRLNAAVAVVQALMNDEKACGRFVQWAAARVEATDAEPQDGPEMSSTETPHDTQPGQSSGLLTPG